MNKLFGIVCKGVYKPIPSKYSKQLRSLVKQMLRVDPTERISIPDLLQCSLLKSDPEFASHETAFSALDGSSMLLKTIYSAKNFS